MSVANYKIITLLGEGGMGRVFLAFDPRLQRQVALKVLGHEMVDNPEMRDRFIKEARKQASMNHPNIATIYEVGEDRDQQFIAMEHIDGATLKSILAKKSLTLDECSKYFLQICDGLQAAHDRQIIHRDIKPANIMITNDGIAKILDFGLAKAQNAGDDTRPGMVMGTVSYMSPEQAQAQPVDARSDIFSMGILLYELLTNRVPFSGDHAISVLFALVHQPHPDVSKGRSDVPPHFSRVINRALEKNPSNRYQSVREMAADLRAPATFGETIMVQPQKGRVSLAVLPFENQGSDKYDYFAEGIGDEINGYLSRLSRLKVISYSSSRQYKPRSRNLKDIGRELDAEFLLEGAVNWDDTRAKPFVRVRVRLVHSADESLRWAETYDREVEQIFAVQSDIGEQVANALGVVLGEPEKKDLASRQTVNVEAYDYFLRANEIFPHSVAEEDLHAAIDLYQKAVETDPQFALAFARLSRVHISMYWFHYDHTPSRLALARRAVDRALSIAPELPEAHQALGYYYYYGQSNYQQALAEFTSVSTQGPNDASIMASKGYIQRRLGQWNEALASIENATDLDPRSALIIYERANTLLLLRRYDEAITYFDRCLWLAPAWSDVYVKKAMSYLLRDWNMKDAVKVFQDASKHINATELAVEWILQDAVVEYFEGDVKRALENLWVDEGEMEIYFLVRARLSLCGGQEAEAKNYFDSARVLLETKTKTQADDARLHMHLGIAYAGLGRREQAIEASKKALEIVPFEKDQILSVFFMELQSMIFAMIGEKDEAVRLLRRLMLIPSNFSLAFLKNFSGFNGLRDYQPFQELIATTDDTPSLIN